MRVARVVTASEAVEFHLRNTLDQFKGEYELEVIGDHVSQYSERWPLVRFTDVQILRKIHLWNDLCALFCLIRIFRQRRFDITHSIMPKAGLLSALAGLVTSTPVRIHTFTGQIWKNDKGFKKFFFKLMDQIIVALSTKCFTDSPSQSEFLCSEGISNKGQPLDFLGRGSLSGVNTERFNLKRLQSERDRIRAEIGAKENSIVFIFLGRKCQDKGTLDLLKAFRKAFATPTEAMLILVGPEDDQSFQDLFYSEFKSQPHIFNFQSTRCPESFLAAGDIFCLPSYREGFGSVVIEAAALGRPTIGSNITGLKDAILDQETGLLISVGDIDELSQKLRLAFDQPEVFKKMGEQAKNRALEQFSMEKLFHLLHQEYALLIQKGSS